MIRRLPGFYRRSIRTQLIVNNVLALTLLLCVFGLIVRYAVRTTVLASVDRELDGRIRRIVEAPRLPAFLMHWGNHPPEREHDHDRDHKDDHHDDHHHDAPVPAAQPPRWMHDTSPYRTGLFDASGNPIILFGDKPPVWDAEALRDAARTRKVIYSTVQADGVTVRVLTHPFPTHGPAAGIVQAPYALTDVERAIGWLDRALLLLSPLALLFAGMGGAFLTDRMLRRVRAMATAAGNIGADDLAARLPIAGDDEFSHLATAFNGLLGRVETAFRAQERLIEMQRRFTADASHELKTPLTTIKGTASMALYAPPSETLFRQSLQEIDRAAGTMSHLVQDLLLLARTDDGQAGREPIEMLLREVLERSLPTVPPGTPVAPITLRVEDETLTVQGNETELVRLFRNLFDNAVRYTPPDGSITATANRVGAFAVVTIADTGIGIAPEHLPHLGERFYRIDASRARPDGGTGLGISISRSIAEAGGGSVTFESVVGAGTTVRVTLPVG